MELSKDDWILTRDQAKGQIIQAQLQIEIAKILIEGCEKKLEKFGKFYTKHAKK